MMAALARQLVMLSKPRIVAMLVFTAVCGVWKAAEGAPEGVVLAVVAGAGALAAAGANAINQGLDADIDAVMSRTRGRPVPSKQMRAGIAVAAGAVLVVVAVALMWVAANAVAAWLTLVAALVYVFVYTVALKRRSWNNIVIGGAAGAFPPLIGAAAVTGTVEAVGVYMFAFVFFWTPPHFWTLSILLKDDYASAKVPMLSTVASERATSLQILLYVVLLVAMGWLPFASGYGGVTFGVVATAMGLYWLWKLRPLSRGPSRTETLAAYKYSLLYLAVVFLALAVEPSLPWY